MKKIAVSDVTLKCIEQQSLSLTFREKLAIAEKLDAANVDVIELPVLANGKENQVIYRTVAAAAKNAKVKIAVGATEEEVKRAAECLKNAKNSGLQVVMPVSTAQMEYFYHLKAPLMKEKIEQLVKCAKQYSDDVEFVALDAFRADKAFVLDIAKSVYELGANTITLSDDAGIAMPEDFADLVSEIKTLSEIKVFVQPSNALSMATACAVAAIKAGADGVKTSAIGEYLSAAVLAELFRAKKFTFVADCAIDVTNVKSIDGIINGMVENSTENQLDTKAEGKISQTATIKDVSEFAKQLGYELSDSDVGKVFEEIKKLTAKKEVIDVKEFEAVIASTAMQVPSTYHLVNYVVNSGNIIPATANVTLEKNGEKITGVSTGDGPIDAAFHAIEQVIGHHYELDDFQVHAVTKGRGAVGSSIIRLRADGKLFPGNGVSTDIVGACIRAYINALNKIVYEEE